MTIEDQIRDEKLHYDVYREKFTYSTLGKAFEKQSKTIEDQGKKEIDALESLKPKEVKSKETKPIGYDDFYINKIPEIQDLSKQTDFNNLTYIYKGKSAPVSFISFKGPLHI